MTRADAESSSETAKGAGSDAAIAARRRGTRRGRVPDATPRRDGAANMSLALERVSPREEVTGCRVIVDDDVRDHVRCVKHPSPEISKPRVDAVGGSVAHSAMRASAVSLSRLVWRRPGAWHRRASWTPLRCTASSDRPSVRPLPRLEPRDGPSYAVDVGGGAVAHLRFLAFHGCGSRFSVLWKADASDEGGGFDAGELERLSATWRVRTAAGSSAALEALEGFDGDDVKRLALRDDDLGARRLYDASDPSWSAARAAPTWPARLLAALDAGGGAAGDDAMVCVDGSYFLELVRLSAFPTPVLFPHGAWRLEGLGPGAPDFHALAAACDGVDAVEALEAARRGGGDDARGRLTADVPGRGRAHIGGAGGRAGVGAALDATTDRRVEVTFGHGPLGLGFAPMNWETGTGAQAWEVDEDSAASDAGVAPGMAFERVDGADVRDESFEDIDALFDGPRPITVTFNSRVPDAERLYAVEMSAEDVMAGLATSSSDARMEGPATSSDAKTRPPYRYVEPAKIFDDVAAVAWREDPSSVFFGDPGSVTVAHHDIVGQIELCHVLSGCKIIAAAPWGASSDVLLAVARRAGEDDDDDDDDDDDEEVEGSTLGVPTHRRLTEDEASMVTHPGLCAVSARPGDVVAFSSAATHFASNGVASPCAAVFHGVLTPAAAHVLAAHPSRLDPFTDRETDEEGFDAHLTGRSALEECLPKKSDVVARDEGVFSEALVGSRAAAAARERFEETTRRMDAAVRWVAAGRTEAPPAWEGATATTFYVEATRRGEARDAT